MNRRIDASSRRSGIVSIVLGGAWALALIAFAAELEWAIAPLRILFSVASLLLSYLFIMSGAAILVVSPLFLLALVAGWGFSIVPALFCAAEYALSGTNYYPRLPEFVGSSAELLILEFALYCLLITLLVSRYWEKTPEIGRAHV